MNLNAGFPVVAELADQIEGAGDENGVMGRGFGESMFEGALGVGDHGKMRGVMADDFGKLRGRDGTGRARRGEDDFGGVREEQAGNFVDGFIAKGGVDQKDFAAGEILFEEVGEFAGGAGIVRAIAVNVGRGLKFFEAAGPDGFGDSLGDGSIGNLEAALLEQASGGEGVQRVLELKTARKAWRDFEDLAGGRFSDASLETALLDGLAIEAKDLRRLNDFTTETLGASENHFTGLRLLPGKDERHTGLEDSGFLARDFGEGVAQEVFVVEIDARDDGDDRRKDIGGVEAAAQADFEDREFNALASKMLEGHSGYAFEIRGISAELARGEKLFDESLDAREGFGEGLVADFFATDADAFVDFFEVGRGIQTGAKAGVPEDGFEERGC